MPRFQTLLSRPILRMRRMLRAGGSVALILDETGQLLVRRDPDSAGALLVAVYSGDVDDDQLLADIESARAELATQRGSRMYVRKAA